MKKHYSRKNPCKKIKDVMFLSDDQLLVLSIIPIYNNMTSILENDISHLKKSNKLDKNKFLLFQELDKIEKNKLKCCGYCNEEFNLMCDLKKHIITKCFIEELEKKEKEENKKNNIDENKNSSSSFNNCESILNTNTNINTQNNTTNNINIILEIKNPISFDNNWDISKIREDTKRDITFSKVMYTRLLEEILNNEINLNVVIDNEKNSGMVYKNDIDKYIQMKSKDIVDKTMEKLNEQLNSINNDNKMSFEEFTTHCRRQINKKYIDFKKDTNIQEKVENVICSIFENKKLYATDVAKKVMENNNNYGY
jgi:hypothetical protein